MPENAEKYQPEHRDEVNASTSTGRERNVLCAYHDIAATLFSLEKADNLEEQFLAAARDGDYDKVQHFLQRRANEFINIDGKDKTTGNSALIWAVKRGHLRIVQLLLKHGADVTLRNYESKTAVELASPAIRQVLLESVERMGCTHRHLLQAAWQGNFEVVRKLLETKTLDINCRNNDGFSPMHLVVRDCHLFEKLSPQLKKNYNPCSVLKELLEYRADVHSYDDDGKSPIHYASLSKCNLSSHLVAILLHDGSSHNARDRRCYTPIHCASQTGNLDVVKTLIDHGSDVNSRAYAGYTPLHISAIHGHEKVAISLLNHGADVTLVDDSGLTPVDVAKNKKVKTTLREAWVDATQQKVEKVVLKPVRPPTRDSSRMSFDESMLQESPRLARKGEVIFDGMDKNPSPNLKNGSPSATRRLSSSLGSRQLTNAEKANKAEEMMILEGGRFTPASPTKDSKSQNLSTFPQSGRQSGNPPRTPDRNLAPIRPKTKSKAKRQSSLPSGNLGEYRDEATTPVPLPGINPRRSYPDITANNQEYPVPITVLTFEPEERDNGQFLEKRHQQDGQDSSFDDYIFKGRSSSKTYIEDLEDQFSPPPHLTPLTSSASDRARLNIPDTITESDQSYREGKVFTFDKVKLAEPVSRMATASRGHQAVPMSTFITQQPSIDTAQDEDKVQVACSNVQELVRGKTLYRDEFNIEDSRLKKSLEMSTDTSTSLSSLSSPSSHSDGSKSEAVNVNNSKDGKSHSVGKVGTSATVRPTAVQRKNSEGTAKAKLQQAAKDNATLAQENKKCASDNGNGKKPDKITVHSDLLGKVYENSATRVEDEKVGAVPVKSSGKPETSKVTVINIGENKFSGKKNNTDKVNSQGKECASKSDLSSSSAGAKSKESVVPNSVVLQKTDKSVAENSGSSQTKAADKKGAPAGTGGTGGMNSKNGSSEKQSSSEPAKAGPDVNSKNTPADKKVAAASTNSKNVTLVKNSSELVKPSPNFNSNATKASPRSNPQQGNQANTPRQAPIRKSSKGAIVVISRANTNANVNETKVAPSKQQQQQKTQASAPTNSQAAPSAVSTPASVDKTPNNEKKTVVIIKKANSKDDLMGKNSKTSPRNKPESSPRQSDSKQTVSGKSEAKTVEIVSKTTSNLNEKSVPKEKDLKVAGDKTPSASDVTKKTPPPRPSQPPNFGPHYEVVQPKLQTDQKQSKAGNSNGTSQSKISTNAKPTSVPTSKPQAEKSTVVPTPQVKVPTPSKSGALPNQSRVPPAVPQPAKSQAEPSMSRTKSAVQQTNKSQVESRVSKIKSVANKSLVLSRSVDGGVVLAPRANEMLREVSKTVASKLEKAIGNNVSDAKVKGKEEVKSPSKSSVAESQVAKSTNEDQATKSPTKISVVGSEDMKSPSKSSLASNVTSNLQQNNVKSVSIVVKSDKPESHSELKEGNQNDLEPVVKVTITQSEEEQKPPEQTPYIRDVFEHFQNPFLNKDATKLSVKREPTKVSRGNTKVGTNRLSSATNKPGKSARGGRSDQKSAQKKTKATDLSVRGVGTPNTGQKATNQPRSGKGKRKSRKKKKKDEKPELGDRDLTKTAFISGIGWHVATDCNENPDVEAVGMVDSDSDSDVEKSEALTFRDDNSNFLKVDIDDEIDEPSSFEELVQEEVHFDSADTDSSKFSSLENDQVENPALSKTIKAIDDFNSKVRDEELDQMLGSDVASGGKAESSTVASHNNVRPSDGNIADFKGNAELSDKQDNKLLPDSLPSALSGGKAEKTGERVREGNLQAMAEPSSKKREENISPREKKDQKFQRSYSMKVKGTDRPKSGERPLKRSNTITGKDRKRRDKEVMESKDINSIIDEILTITSDHSTLNDSITNSLRRKNSLTRLTKEAEARKSGEAGHLDNVNEVGAKLEEVAKKLVESKLVADYDDDDDGTLHDDYITLPEMLKIFHANDQEEMEAKIHLLSDEQGNEIPEVVFDPPSTKTPKDSRKSSKQEQGNLVLKKSLGEKPPLPERPKSSLGKSPRSIKPPKQKHVYRELKTKEMYNSKESLASTFQTSEFGSDQFSLACSEGSTLTEEGLQELVDSRTIRSQLGRRSAASQAGSSCTSDSYPADDVICWKKGNMLGRGAYGTVWCGLTDSGGLIAVKLIEMNTVDMEKAEREYEKIQEEVDMLKALRHKNIVGFSGTSLEDHTVQIFMEYVPGGSIANLLARFGALEEAVFCIYTKQVLEGVEYIHGNGVIHRDIKGGNIMLTQDGIIKLIDFGCAKRLCMNSSLSQGQLLKSMRGTPYWMAPEVVSETGHGKKSDIWSIGCTVFEMATRKPPWADMNPMAAIFAIGSDRPVPELDNSFTPTARDFVKSCLQRIVEKRPLASELLLHPFIARSSRRIKRRNTSSAHGSSAIFSNLGNQR